MEVKKKLNYQGKEYTVIGVSMRNLLNILIDAESLDVNYPVHYDLDCKLDNDDKVYAIYMVSSYDTFVKLHDNISGCYMYMDDTDIDMDWEYPVDDIVKTGEYN